MKRFLMAGVVFSAVSGAAAQVKTAEQILAEPAVQAAMKSIQANEPKFIEEQIKLTEIPAPPFHEAARGLELQKLFTQAGLRNVRIDAAGNVLGDLPGKEAHPHLVIAAHQDTVFPEGTDVTVKRNGSVLSAPGIGDDGRGLAALLALIDAMQQNKLATRGTITFVADTGEGRPGRFARHQGAVCYNAEGPDRRVHLDRRYRYDAGCADRRGKLSLSRDVLAVLADIAMELSGWPIRRMRWGGQWRRLPTSKRQRSPKRPITLAASAAALR